MNPTILASTDPVMVSTVIQYAMTIVGGMLSLLVMLIAALWSQNRKQNEAVLGQLQKQTETIDRKLDGCRAKDDASHKSFHVDIEALRATMSGVKERVAVLEVRTENIEDREGA